MSARRAPALGTAPCAALPAVLAAALAAALVAACASATPELDRHTSRERAQLVFEGRSVAVELQPDDRVVETPLRMSAERAWAVLPAVYSALGLPVTTMVTDSRIIGTQGAQAPRRVGGEPLSRALSCGVGPLGQDNVDHYEITLLALSDVKPDEGAGGSLLRTLVRGSARAPGTSDAAVRCTSRGRIEQRVEQLVRERAAVAPRD